MKLSIEIEAEDWLELCRLHKEVMDLMGSNMAENPLAYSTAARITNEVLDQVIKKMPYGELDRIKDRQGKEQDY